MQRRDPNGQQPFDRDNQPRSDFEVVPATPEPFEPYVGDPTQANPTTDPRLSNDPHFARTTVQPVVQPARQVVAQPAGVVYQQAVAEPLMVQQFPPDDPYLQARERSPWAAVALAAVAALLLGAIGGFLLGRSSDDDDGQAVTNAPVNTGAVDQAAVDQSVDNVFKMLTDQAQQDGGIQTPTAYPNLDSLLGVLASSATPASSVDTGVQQADVDLLTADRDELAAEVATLQEQIEPLQEQLAEVEAERDDLQEMVESSGGTTSELQAKLDEQTDQIATLYSDVVAAQEGLDQAQGDLEGVQADLDAANAMLTDLNLLKLEDLAGQPAEKARAMAQANGWTLVEQVGEIGKGQPDTVIQQAPAPGTQMITGSVLYIEVSPKR